jgi:hypothetical protein
MNRVFGAYGARMDAVAGQYAIMGAAGHTSGPGGTGLSDTGKGYTDSQGGGYTQIPAFDMPELEVGRFPRLPRMQPGDPKPIYDYPPNGGGGQRLPTGVLPAGVRIPAGTSIPAGFRPRFNNEVNVYVQGGGPVPSPSPEVESTLAQTVTTLTDAGTSAPLQVYETPTSDLPVQYVWGIGYVPEWQAVELKQDPVKLDKAQKAVKRHRMKKGAMAVGALLLGYFVARAARKA